jgi:hypothetical protein
LHNFDLAGKGRTYRRLNDCEDIMRGGLLSLDINEEMSWDAAAIHGEYSIGLPQGGFKSRLRFTAV